MILFQKTAAEKMRGGIKNPNGFSCAVGIFALAVFLTLAAKISAAEISALELSPSAQVNDAGIFLSQVAQGDFVLPEIKLCDAPAFGQTLDLTRAQVGNFLANTGSNLVASNLQWSGADEIHISRKTRSLNEADALALLTSTLQKKFVRSRGELELVFTQPWSALTVPDEPLTVKILELPASGVAPSFILRFQLCTATEIVGTWQTSLQAHVWRDVWVAHSNLRRDELMSEADVAQDRRDVLNINEELADFSPQDSSLQLANPVSSGAILLARNFKARSVLHRGQMADAVLQDGALNIMLKVEVLEDGAPGQLVRVRNPVSLHNLSGRVIDDQTVSISL